MSKFFINRPIVAIVIAIMTVILGSIMLATLPVAQFPKIAPPEIRLGATYIGADAQTLEQAVATPIEQQVSGVDHMTYIKISLERHRQSADDVVCGFRSQHGSQYGSDSHAVARTAGKWPVAAPGE